MQVIKSSAKTSQNLNKPAITGNVSQYKNEYQKTALKSIDKFSKKKKKPTIITVTLINFHASTIQKLKQNVQKSQEFMSEENVIT